MTEAATSDRSTRGQFSLQRRVEFGTFADVRMIVVIGILFIGVTTSWAQDQERKLIDRILKPNTALANSAQNKKFTNTRAAYLDKSVPTRSFYSPKKPVLKTLPEERVFTPRQFAARHFRAGDSIANISSRSQLKNNDTMIAIPAAAAGTRVAPESTTTRTTPIREYAGSRPFLDQGKSQKALSAQNKPLTIEQVRELLNKSK
ncbi:MAG: hypothetical protein DME97_07640 [Verrucomicrobia bacterium]|nr:MAG: hypothetical protein DME97_07640 [Verrucomicrobiota bacterium]